MVKHIKRLFYKVVRKAILKSLSEKYGKDDFGRLRAILFDAFSADYIVEDYPKIDKAIAGIDPILKDRSMRFLLEAYPELNEQRCSGRQLIFDSSANIKVGKNVKFYSPYHIYESSIGDYTYIAQNPYISFATIGRFCSIGPNLICGWGIHPLNGISTHPMFFSTFKQNGMTLSSEDKVEERKHITIGNDVFIGANVIVLDGVTIGDGAVIGAGAVVSKDIPPYAVAVGCPIKILRYRFSEDLCKRLREIKWWDFDLEHLKDVEANIFNVNKFVDTYENRKEL